MMILTQWCTVIQDGLFPHIDLSSPQWMPTSTFSAALLLLSNTEGMPWSTSPWELITKAHGVLLLFKPNTTDNNLATNYLS